MLYGQWIHGTQDLGKVREVREKVFIEEQGWPREVEMDEFDKQGWHALVVDEEKPVATGRVYIEDGKYKIGRVCVDKEYRGRGLGDIIIRSLIGRALDAGAPGVHVSAQEYVKEMYEKYGFTTQGDAYDHGGRMHVDMYVSADDVLLPGSCGGGCSGCKGCR